MRRRHVLFSSLVTAALLASLARYHEAGESWRTRPGERADDLIYGAQGMTRWPSWPCTLTAEVRTPLDRSRDRLVAWTTRPLAMVNDRRMLRTMRSMRSIAGACAVYTQDHGALPRADSVADLRSLDKSMRDLPTHDGWGEAFAFRADEGGYEVRSRGSDRRWQSNEIKLPPEAIFAPATQRQLLSDLLLF